MYTPILIASFISSINAAAIISRSQSYPLSQCSALGPQTTLTIGNNVVAPDGYSRSATLVNGEFPVPLISAQKGDNFSILVANELTDTSMYTVTSVHWHGIYQNGTSIVTQCPIAQNQSYLQSFSAQNQAGTYWYHSHYSVQYCDGNVADSTLINGLGRYAGGPMSYLAVINVEQGKRYYMRLVSMSCDPNFLFSIDGHNMTVIEADGQLTNPLEVDQLQRVNVTLLPDTANASFVGGTNSAILRYQGAPQVEPTTVNTTSTNPLVETNLHALINPSAPGVPEYGAVDINLNLAVSIDNGIFYVNNVSFAAPTVPVLLQILSGAQDASELMPNGSVIILEANKVVELTLSTTGVGGPHPIHMFGHSFSVVQSAGNSSFNYANPVRRDVVSAGSLGQQMVIRWVTDNSDPWFLHCGFAVVMAESLSDTRAHMNPVPDAWDQLCRSFENRLHGDDRVFLEEYPEANRGAKPLFDAIQRKREGRGEITGRASKNGRPEVRASASR
ncbi:laccase [Suillus subluteus]|nr:laccase [Suillus subluteus]